jgi:TDG/mug DNA glycosylase family protein
MDNEPIEVVKLEEEDEEEVSIEHANIPLSKPPASFQGRLNLSSYAFSPPTSPKPSADASTKTPAKSPPKRSSQNLSPSPTPKKKPKRKLPSSYGPPSKYAHLPELTDILAPSLLLLFIGLNPASQPLSADTLIPTTPTDSGPFYTPQESYLES